MTYRNELAAVVEECLRRGCRERKQTPECYERFRERHGIRSRRELDGVLFEKMYGREPDRSELQRMRFWRLSQHLPKSREEGILLGKALELSGEELEWFLREQLCFRSLQPEVYVAEVLPILFREYLCGISRERLALLQIDYGMQEHFRRHIFYADAIDCISGNDRMRKIQYREHLYSKNFSGEMKLYFQKDAVLSREKVMRLLILLLLPDVDASVLDGWLKKLGYAPLNPQRVWNGYVDEAVLRVLGICDARKTGERKKDKDMMKKVLADYDRLVQNRLEKEEKRELQRLLRNLRFMKFRSFGEEQYGKENQR